MEKNEKIRGILQIWRCRRKRLVLKASSEILFLENKHSGHGPVFFIFDCFPKKVFLKTCRWRPAACGIS